METQQLWEAQWQEFLMEKQVNRTELKVFPLLRSAVMKECRLYGKFATGRIRAREKNRGTVISKSILASLMP